MPAALGVARSPYTVTWRGAIAILHSQHGVLSSHRRLDLAVAAARRQRDDLASLWGSGRSWFIYTIVDARNGDVLKTIH